MTLLGRRKEPEAEIVYGQLIRDTRQALGFTLQEVSDRSGVSVSRISRIENGSTASAMVWKDIAEALGLEFVPAVPFEIRRRS